MPYESRKNNHDNTNTKNNINSTGSNNTSLSSLKDRERQKRENATSKAIGTAAEGAGAYFGGPLGKKAANKALNTKAGQKIVNQGAQVLNKIPGVGTTTKKLDEKKVFSKEDKIFRNNKNKIPENQNSMNNNADANGGENRNNSLPSSVSQTLTNKQENSLNIAGLGPFVKNDYSKENINRSESDKENEKEKKKKRKAFGTFTFPLILKIIIILAPIFIILILILAIISTISGSVGDFDDAFGASTAAGEETGDIVYEAENPEAASFYEKINNVKLSYQAMGKNVDVLKIAAVYHILFSGNLNYSYEDMTDDMIKEIADTMFSGNSYSEDIFKTNLTEYLIPKYMPNSTDAEREQIVTDIFDYIDRYYSFIGKETDTACATIGSCIYDIKGFYIPGSGNVSKNINVSNLMVRLMECGGAYGNGNDNKPIDQDLVPFEDYITGVAYAEVGTSFHDEAIKAQMVVARSYALARPTAMGNAAGKKLAQENGQWILQIASCVSDQVFCNVDEGCSYMGGGDGQGGFVRSGIVPGAVRTNPPLPENHRLRTLAAEVQGEVLVNDQGYIIGSGFLSSDQREFERLATAGLNYKQIIMQVYNKGSRNYGASDIEKANCNDGNSSCSGSSSTGPFSTWKQYSSSWSAVPLGTSKKTINSAGCLVTSVAMLIAKSGVQTNISNFNPGTFVQKLNSVGGFSGANFIWSSASKVAPSFTYQGKINVAGKSKKEKFNTLKGLLESGYYVVAEVKGSTGEHWVAIDGISGNTILMMDPGSESTDMWGQYSWKNTSQFSYYKAS